MQVDDDITLRMFTEDDAKEFYMLTMQSRKHLQQWLSWIHSYYSIEDTIGYIRGTWDSIKKTGGYPTAFAIIYRNEIAGTISFHEIDRTNRSSAIGYWLGEPFVGKGIMSRAFQAMVKYGFETLNLNRIEVRVAEGNI